MLKGKKLEADERRIAAENSKKKDLKKFDKKTKCWKKLKNAKSCCKDDQLNENLQKSLKDQEVAEKHANNNMQICNFCLLFIYAM